jgi:predicted metal-dependent HD superfamily phosphohydrolase
MAILIDPPAWPAHGTLWSHLVSDTDYEELHAFAARLGVPRRGFDLDHYDVPAARYEQAIALGARAVTAKEVVHSLRSAGLRVRQVDREAVIPQRRREYLSAAWNVLGDQLGFADLRQPAQPSQPALPHGTWHGLGTELLARWNEPHRSYHNERHLEDVLLSLNHLGTRGERISPVTLLAAWFHDAVYERSDTDERRSAEFASAALRGFGLDADLVGQVHELVLATTPGHKVRDPAPPLAHLLDADLAIFAAPPHRYEEYTLSVRREYAHVAADAFAAGRAQILGQYLARPAIYQTAVAQELWERRARENVEREIAELLGH